MLELVLDKLFDSDESENEERDDMTLLYLNFKLASL
jgi:hypothetical protein